MIRISLDEFCRNPGKYLKDVKGGHTVHILDKGALVAVLAPPSRGQTALERLIAEGKVIPASAPFVFPEPVDPLPGHPSGSEALEEQKAENLP